MIKLNYKIIISFSLIYILVPFILIFPLYNISGCSNNKDLIVVDVLGKEARTVAYCLNKDMDILKNETNQRLTKLNNGKCLEKNKANRNYY